MTKKIVFFFFLLTGLPLPGLAQETKPEPKGQAILQIFTNFHTGFGKINDQRGFDLDRSYLGYQYKLTEGLTAKAVLDIGKSNSVNDYHRIAYIKNAQLTWQTGKWCLQGGLICATQFHMQEKFWGYRYIMKSFQDEYKFGHSADLGVSAAYQFSDWFSADAIITNGEGYKKIQVKDGLHYGVGTTFTPLKGWSVRLYAGLNEAAEKEQKDIWNYAVFTGFKNEHFSIGTEFNYMQNDAFTSDADRFGLSVYGAVKIGTITELYGRYDNLFSRNDWNIEKDEQNFMAGAQFKLGKYVKLSPNVRVALPKADGSDAECSAYLNCYFGL